MKSNSVAVASQHALIQHDRLRPVTPGPDPKRAFFFIKRAVDLTFAIAVLPFLAFFAFVLLFVNAVVDPGPVFFQQLRMGKDGKPFRIWKFRTMMQSGEGLRRADAPLEEDRITPVGRLLRRTKLDELPNVLNILAGDMSLVGPRPDAYDHATSYLADVPLYNKRLAFRPGITGLAQVRGGYADNPRAVERKARYDDLYVRKADWALDAFVILLTVKVVLSGFGQR